MVGFFNIAHVAAETVFIQLFVGVPVPQAAGVRSNFVGKDDVAFAVDAVLGFKSIRRTLRCARKSFNTALILSAISRILAICSSVAKPKASP